MPYPDDPIPLSAELQLDGVWTDVTDHVYTRDPIGSRRGQPNESADVAAASCQLTLDNRDGRFTPDNPNGAYYGKIGRNTPFRLGVALGDTYLNLGFDSPDYTSTPDHASLDIAGDIDLRCELQPEVWRNGSGQTVASKYETTLDERSWAWTIDFFGRQSFLWSPDGTLASRQSLNSAVHVPLGNSNRTAIRVSVDFQASAVVATYWTGPTIAGPWVAYDQQTHGAASSIHAGTAELQVGHITDLLLSRYPARFFAFELRNGIDGTVVANPDFTAQAAGATSFADAAGRTWSIQGGAELTKRRPRFHGEIAAWPPEADLSGTDVWTRVDVAGPLRRLGQQGSATDSILKRALPEILGNQLIAYWPVEDARDSTQIASHGPQARAMRKSDGGILAASDDVFLASGPLPEMHTGEYSGRLPYRAPTGQVQTTLLCYIPEPRTSIQSIAMLHCTGVIRRASLYYDPAGAGSLGVDCFDEDSTKIFDTGPINFAMHDKPSIVQFALVESGADVAWHIDVSTLATGFTQFSDGTFLGTTFERPWRVVLNNGGGLGPTVLGHLTVIDAYVGLREGVSDTGAKMRDAAMAYDGRERAATRVQRLANEQELSFRFISQPNILSEIVGAQLPNDVPSLLAESVAADMGVLYEQRDALGFAYRERAALYNEPAALTIDHSALAAPLAPVTDDQQTANDVTVSRERGSSYQDERVSGPRGITAIGRYTDKPTVNVAEDSQLADLVGWRLNLGTVDEPRYPGVIIRTEAPAIAGNPDLLTDVLDLEIGQRIRITGLPGWLPPDDVDLIVFGMSERITSHGHEIQLHCGPAEPYTVATYDDGQSRYGAFSTVLDEDLDTIETAVNIASGAGPEWTMEIGDLPFDVIIGGERMTVTGVASLGGGVQTLTVVRSVNGIVATHLIGEPVELFEPVRWAM